MTAHKEQSDQVAEFLAGGGEIQEIPRGKSGYVEGQSRSAWGAPRKKTVSAEPAVAEKPQKRAKK
jgi:hypothetical protein